jgi:hypothetical protein
LKLAYTAAAAVAAKQNGMNKFLSSQHYSRTVFLHRSAASCHILVLGILRVQVSWHEAAEEAEFHARYCASVCHVAQAASKTLAILQATGSLLPASWIAL